MSEFWQGRRVLITGNTGFKGSWLSIWLNELGALVRGYSLEPPTCPSLYNEANLFDIIPTDIADIRDLRKLKNTIQDFQPEVVFHLAAQPLVRQSYEDPIETYSINVMGTVNLLEAIRQAKCVKAVVNITSDKCYENKEWEWGYRECEPMGGYDPYSNSKGCSELVTASFRQSFFNAESYQEHGCAVASVRAGNVIGGGDWAADRLIPDLLNSFTNGIKAEIRNPHAIRPWQHVLEPLFGYILLAERLHDYGFEFAEAWNFGPAEYDAKPVKWIADSLINSWGQDADWFQSVGDHPHEAHYLKLDCSKAKMRLGWEPLWDLEISLQKIVDWHKAWLNKEDMQKYTKNEINEYIAKRAKLECHKLN